MFRGAAFTAQLIIFGIFAICSAAASDAKIHGETPWHAGVYSKKTVPYRQIGGASLVSPKNVISVAHLFWDEIEGKLQSTNLFAVGLGKIYRPWDDQRDLDANAQQSNVTEIHVPVSYRGSVVNFQSDISVLVLEIAVTFSPTVQPASITFDVSASSRILQHGNIGKLPGWGAKSPNAGPSTVLKILELPVVSFDRCYEDLPSDFRQYLTSDKFCAGYVNGTAAVCRGDTGGGLVFPVLVEGKQEYYLQGMPSVAPVQYDDLCNFHTRTLFTDVSKYENFIKQHVNFVLHHTYIGTGENL